MWSAAVLQSGGNIPDKDRSGFGTRQTDQVTRRHSILGGCCYAAWVLHQSLYVYMYVIICKHICLHLCQSCFVLFLDTRLLTGPGLIIHWGRLSAPAPAQVCRCALVTPSFLCRCWESELRSSDLGSQRVTPHSRSHLLDNTWKIKCPNSSWIIPRY